MSGTSLGQNNPQSFVSGDFHSPDPCSSQLKLSSENFRKESKKIKENEAISKMPDSFEMVRMQKVEATRNNGENKENVFTN